jgi:mannose-6-phosphate isomerase-like protein (cupin superfamily)
MMTTSPDSNQSEPVLILTNAEASAFDARFGTMTFVVKPFARTEPHAHASEETWIVRGVSGHATVGTQIIALLAGQKVIVPAGIDHSIVNDGPLPLSVIAFWWKPDDASTQ